MGKGKNHKGMLKRIIVRKGGVLMKRASSNKYATKRSARSNSSRRATKLFQVPRYYLRVLKRMVPGLRVWR